MTAMGPQRDRFDAVIERPGGPHNVYRWDARRQAIRYAAFRDGAASPFEIGAVLGPSGYPLEGVKALIPLANPTFEGCLVRFRAVGGWKINDTLFVLGTPEADAPDEPAVRTSPPDVEAAFTFMQSLTESETVRTLSKDEALDALTDAFRRAAAIVRPQYASGAAWKVAGPRTSAHGERSHYTWAENMVPRLPLRFQRFVEELLFDDERILFFLHHPPFAVTAGRFRLSPRRREQEGLLLVTDRSVMVLRDIMPSGPSLVHWGYEVRIAAIERLRDAQTTSKGPTTELRLAVGASGGTEHLAIRFPAACAEALADAMPLLRQFSHPPSGSVRRVYAPAPQWRAPEAGRAGRAPGSADLTAAVESSSVVAATSGGTARLSQQVLHLDIPSNRPSAIDVDAISTIELTRALVGCRLSVTWFHAGAMQRSSFRFEYPESSAILALVAQLRHLLGQPEHRCGRGEA